ncbi:MAG: AAA family ATPase [Caldilineaceae bacterium SB0661_bin_32]|uniref:AAA family ATPase n=1 Tax=Caldilineaceae bacterium SB0661_bin_32 TaxID=2605255 RepID=A0A6B1D8P3_9CHLR|nr:AAA family ATPase [Caldilineaceae bacterium SB0661_bin_32]
MALTRVRLRRFTAFEELEVEFSPGINVFVGDNGTGKTHLMKVCYAACDASKSHITFDNKLIDVFLPSGRVLGRLIKRQQGSKRGAVEVFRDKRRLRASFSNLARAPTSPTITGATQWAEPPIKSVYIPPKEMLANAPGFRSLYGQRQIQFEAVYDDLLQWAFLPLPRGRIETQIKHLFPDLERALRGKVTVDNEEFFLRSGQGKIEFTLLAEGIRKLGLLWILLRNGTLQEGSVLFWDEPETNLNPKYFGVVIKVLLELQRMGVQIFFATHDYVILKELDLRRKSKDKVVFHSLHRQEETGDISCNSTDSFLEIDPNAISDTFDDLYDREVERSLGHLVQ